MDDQARAIGWRVRYWRLRRNLDRKRFADMVGRSVSWLDKVEKGERSLLRLPMLERVADVLGIDPTVLTDAPIARRAETCVDGVEVQAIRSALGRYPSLAPPRGGRPVTVAGVTRGLSYVNNAWLSSHFTVVSRHLPGLLSDAQALTLIAPEADQLTAHRALVVAYRLASSMLLKFETTDIAWLAADRAMHTALSTDDTVALARATRSVARAMTGTGQRTDAIAALIGMTDRMRYELVAHEHELLSLYGMLFLAAAIAAAGEEDSQLAQYMHEEAEAAARRMGPQHQTHQTNFQLDLTEASTLTGQYQQAVRALEQAERVAPEEVRCRPLAHGLLRSLVNNTSGEPARSIRAIATRAGVTA